MESSSLVTQFISKTGSTQTDAIRCLKTWDWDLNRAITDYNDTSAVSIASITKTRVSYQDQPDDFYPVTKVKPSLVKSDSIDIVDYRKLGRGISRATDNINLVSRARTEIAMDFHSVSQKNVEPHSLDTPDCTFILPNIFDYPDQFRYFLEKDLIECSTLTALEQTFRLNWWNESGVCRKLWPLATTGDGNCLLHAASLGMWGFHDRKLTLRTALYSLLTNGECRESLYRRWRFQQTRLNKKAGFVYSDVEWEREWNEIVTMSSPKPRHSSNSQMDSRRRISFSERGKLVAADSIDDTATYESLEEIHILALAHILRRAIVVISDTVLRDLNGEAMAPIPFGGIYLPFEINSAECNIGPLLLAYDMAHFSALVPMENANDLPPTLIPLVDSVNVLLPIQFCIDPGDDFDWKKYDGNEGNWALTDREHIALLREYLDIIYAGNSGSPDEEIYEDLTDEENDKKFIESEMIILSNQPSNSDESQTNKSKAAKQLQNVAKQFGSIGKSMSKKIKKNIGSITKIGGKNISKKNLSSGSSTQSFTCLRILCARLRVKRHQFQEAMIRNYLDCAHSRFLESQKNRVDRDNVINSYGIDMVDSMYCVNSGCKNFGNAETSFLCIDCYENQRRCESTAFLSSAPRYGTGKSKFYAQADINSHDSIKQLVPVRRLSELDQTLYLSNSTFYNDNLPPAYNKIGIPNNDTLYRHGYSPTQTNDDKVEIKSSNEAALSSGRIAEAKISLLPSTQVGCSLTTDSSRPSNPALSLHPLTHLSPYVSTSSIIQTETRPCKTVGCLFYGSSNTSFYCSKCCQAKNNIPFSTNMSSGPVIRKTINKIMSDL